MTWDWIEPTAAVAGVGVAVAAAGAALFTALKANATAESMKQIEKDRWHDHLTPQLRFTFEPQGADLSTVRLRIALEGPTALEHLDGLALSIRDDRPDRAADQRVLHAGGPTEQEIRDIIWGPYRLRSLTGVDQLGRTAAPKPLQRGEELVFWLEHTLPPHWGDGASWKRTHVQGKPLRIAIHCNLDGHKPWYLPYEWLPPANTA